VRSAAVDKLNDQELLAKIAVNDKHSSVRTTATMKLKGPRKNKLIKKRPKGAGYSSPGQRPGLGCNTKFDALKGQVNFTRRDGFGHDFNLPFQGVAFCCMPFPGRCPGLE